jgi:hypothetical protein
MLDACMSTGLSKIAKNNLVSIKRLTTLFKFYGRTQSKKTCKETGS